MYTKEIIKSALVSGTKLGHLVKPGSKHRLGDKAQNLTRVTRFSSGKNYGSFKDLDVYACISATGLCDVRVFENVKKISPPRHKRLTGCHVGGEEM